MSTLPRIDKGFFGGSRVYGAPREDSDLDVVVLVNKEAIEQFKATADSFKVWENGTVSFRFGKLNLITMIDPGLYARWHRACAMLGLEKPVTKSRACEVHAQEGATAGESEGPS